MSKQIIDIKRKQTEQTHSYRPCQYAENNQYAHEKINELNQKKR